MRIISDIRYYGYPETMDDKRISIVLHRIAMKLREQGFSLGDFDHLYLTDRPHHDGDFYRYFETSGKPPLEALEKLLTEQFATQAFPAEQIQAAIQEAVTQGPNMTMHFKEKKTTTRRTTIALRLTDDGMYLPLLRVYDLENNLLLQTDLPEMLELRALGEIQLSRTKVTIKPRKNVFAENMQPLTYTY